MLPSTPQVESVYLDPHTGILAGIPSEAPAIQSERASLPYEPDEGTDYPDSAHSTAAGDVGGPHTLLIDQTTLDPTAAIRIAERIQKETKGGAEMLDAPVSGGESPVLPGAAALRV